MDWVYRKENSHSKSKQCKLFNIASENHPLARTVSVSLVDDKSAAKVIKAVEKKEPKLVVTAWDGLDPLSAALSSSSEVFQEQKPSKNERFAQAQKKPNFIEDDFTSWSVYKSKILNKFITVEKLSIKSSFLSDKSGGSKSAASSVSQKVKDRLEQLDDFEEGTMHEMLNLTQPEYVKRIEELNVALIEAWDNDQKVKALKIAIQCAKQLSSTSVIHYYPSKFVLITDILDTFGSLVYNRLLNKANDVKEDINFVQETCRNWFYKISSIRELLPRFYIETSILKVYSFLVNGNAALYAEYEKIFNRLTKMIRGIGDPLVATYCRVYLCRVAIDLYPEAKKIFQQNIYDIFNSVNQLNSIAVQQTLNQQKADYFVYYTLFTPALDWMFSCAFYKADTDIFNEVLSSFKNLSSSNIQSGCSALILNSLITSYPASFIFTHLIEFIDFIKHVNKDILVDDGKATISTSVYPKYILIKNIGDSLNSMENLVELSLDNKNAVLADVWKITHKLKSKHEYISCLETWSEIIAKYYSISDINMLLGDIVSNLSPNREFENYSASLFTILSKVVQHGSDRFHYSIFFPMSNLMSFLDLFHKENVKIDACKMIVESFIKSFAPPATVAALSAKSRSSSLSSPDEVGGVVEPFDETTSDPVILNSITYLCKIMHDSITALSLEDEKRQISTLITGFIRRISFNRDFEAQLNFYVESRANFSNLDHVLSFLVLQVNSLAMETHQIVKGHHTKKTISFVNACIAFSYITIPSIEDILIRLQLYLSSSHVALVNVCLPQTDAFLKSAITLLRQLPSHSEGPDGKLYSNDDFLQSYVSQVLSTLIVVPDNPELGYLYLFKGLYNVLKEYNFDVTSNCKFIIWSNIIRYLVNCTLDYYPYHVNKVDSNDALYAQDEEFLKEIHTYCDIVFQELLDNFKRNQNDDFKRQCNNAIEIINLILTIGNAQSMSHVINQLWTWISKNHAKHGVKDSLLERKMKITLQSIKRSFTANE